MEEEVPKAGKGERGEGGIIMLRCHAKRPSHPSQSISSVNQGSQCLWPCFKEREREGGEGGRVGGVFPTNTQRVEILDMEHGKT